MNYLGMENPSKDGSSNFQQNYQRDNHCILHDTRKAKRSQLFNVIYSQVTTRLINYEKTCYNSISFYLFHLKKHSYHSFRLISTKLN